VKVLLTGSDGQLGRCLAESAPKFANLISANRGVCDLRNAASITRLLENSRPDLVVNAAAYTAVDKAESEPELARQVNTDAVGIIAEYCSLNDARLIHISTDFVFDGLTSTPYLPNDTPHPLGIYGQTKLAGEKLALERCPATDIVRSSWAYSSYEPNFVSTMLRLGESLDELSVVNDQIGAPTYGPNLAKLVWQIASSRTDDEEQRIWHWSDHGETSWYDFAVAIFAESFELGLLQRMPTVKPISSEEYGAAAQRPPYSVLDTRQTAAKFGIEAINWQTALHTHLARLSAEKAATPFAKIDPTKACKT